jgi:hypothetical protein
MTGDRGVAPPVAPLHRSWTSSRLRAGTPFGAAKGGDGEAEGVITKYRGRHLFPSPPVGEGGFERERETG